tara:strand:- start:687 stop:824 length:138 start_codon:yes stop_codon:yes gene_type:complete
MLFKLKQSPDEKRRSLLSFDNPTKLIESIKFLDGTEVIFEIRIIA